MTRWTRALGLLPLLAAFACSDAATTDGARTGDPPGGPGGGTADGGGDESPPTDDFTVTKVTLFQSLEIPLYPEKDLATVPLLAAKDTLVRVTVRPKSGTATVTKVFAAAQLGDATPVAGAPADVATGDTVLDVLVPAAQLTADATLRVKVMPEGAAATSSGAIGVWPSSGTPEPLTPEISAAVHVVVVPVNTVKSAQYGLVTVTPEVLADFRKYVLASFPIGKDRLQMEVHATYTTQLTPSDTYPNELLDEIAALHTADKAGNEVRYLALFDFDDAAFTIDTTKAGAIFGGLATYTTKTSVMNHTTTHPSAIVRFVLGRYGITAPWQAAQSPSFQSTIANAEVCPIDITQRHMKSMRSVERAYGLAVHELGHLYSLKHVSTTLRPFSAPDKDETFPRSDGKIGLTGYDASTGRFYEPTCFTDFLGYSNLQWISDHNYRSLHDLMRGN